MTTATLSPDRAALLADIEALGPAWHGAGSVSADVLGAIARLAPAGGWANTLETGCGRTSLLLARLGRRHTIFTFTAADTHYAPDNSHRQTLTNPLLNAEAVRWVLGPTQRTMPAFAFEGPYDFALLDGPHSYPFVELEYFYVYPHVAAGGYLAVDDIHIPTVHRLYEFLREDAMWEPAGVTDNTAFFRRTGAPLFDPYGDDWQGQRFNAARFPVTAHVPPTPLPVRLRRAVGRVLPRPVKAAAKRLLGRA